MSKLSKMQLATQAEVQTIIGQEILSQEDKIFVMENYHEGFSKGIAGAFFTPLQMSSDFAFDAIGCTPQDGIKYRVIDLCAGIGNLSKAIIDRYKAVVEVICVEINPEFVELGKKMVPEATWYCADVLDLDFILDLGPFDICISNPPFGKVKTMKGKKTFYYTGSESEYKVLDVGSVIAENCAFIMPQASAGFAFSGQPYYKRLDNDKYKKLVYDTGLHLDVDMSVDTSNLGDFKDANIVVEFAHAETCHIKAPPVPAAIPEQASLFG
jgi:hypothetical protein